MTYARCRMLFGALLVAAGVSANATHASTWYVDPDTTNPVTDKVCLSDGVTPCNSVADCPALDRCVLSEPTTSWCNAAVSLHDAIESAELLDTIKVADGTYFPDSSGLAEPRRATFRLPISNVTIQGGYAGCGSADPDARDFIQFESILSGDFAGNDDPEAPAGTGGSCCQAPHAAGCDDAACQAAVCAEFSPCCIPGSTSWSTSCRDRATRLCCNLCGDNVSRCDNSFHVVTGNESLGTAVLDGFTITGGNAGPSNVPDGVGGGMLNDRGSPKVLNCTFRENTASRGGGGVYNKGEILARSTPQFFNCRFDANVVTGTGPGGGAYNVDSNPTFTNSLFAGNRSNNSWGGAIFSGRSGPSGGSTTVLANCTIAENFALSVGGGVAFENGNPTVRNSIIWGNTGGPAISLEEQQVGRFTSPVLAMTNSCVEGCRTVSGGLCLTPTSNIGNDAFLHNPYFVPGPIGCYYLSDTAGGEPFDSACIDAGGALASAISAGDGTTLASRTTQSGEVLDSSTVDLGYHYPDTAAPVDPETGLKFLLGDQDRDGVVDLFDYDGFAFCLGRIEGGEVPACCRIFDYELDGDVDVEDYTGFQDSFSPQ